MLKNVIAKTDLCSCGDWSGRSEIVRAGARRLAWRLQPELNFLFMGIAVLLFRPHNLLHQAHSDYRGYSPLFKSHLILLPNKVTLTATRGWDFNIAFGGGYNSTQHAVSKPLILKMFIIYINSCKLQAEMSSHD